MQSISYTISPFLIRTMETINTLRREILLTPLSPKSETALRFEAMVSRIKSTLSISKIEMTKEEISEILADYKSLVGPDNAKKNRKKLPVKLIVSYKHAFDFILQEWLVSTKNIKASDLIILHNTASKGQLRVPEKRIQEILDYLQTSSDNSIVQAAIAKLQFTQLEPFTLGNDIFSTLVSYLFLYKTGLDFRGLLILEKTWTDKPNIYLKEYQNAINRTHITAWLEYFAVSMQDRLLEAIEHMKKADLASLIKSVEMNERQMKILTLLDKPNAFITNRQVQELFAISQITASRDLAKLAGMGLLFTYGKGRSVRYTKV